MDTTTNIVSDIKGLILMGGVSSRMGSDKSELNYHGKKQKEFVRELLEAVGIKSYYSVREDKGNSDEIHDVFSNIGPFGGICSAFQKDPNSAWFVMATDLPFVNAPLIQKLIRQRNPSKVATVVKGKNNKHLEPLIAIYESRANDVFMQYLEQGNLSPSKVLMHSDIEILEVEDGLIRNINTPEEYKAAKEELA